MKTILTLICVSISLITGQCTESSPVITFHDFRLVGDLSGGRAAFTLTGVAHVENSKGGVLEILSGRVGLTEVNSNPKWRLRTEDNRFEIVFERAGKFPIEIKFNASVTQADDWNTVDFRVAPGTVQPVMLEGLPADTKFNFAGAARPERVGDTFKSFLPADGAVKLAWKEARTESEGKLFYSAEMLSQISISPGLMRQTALLDFKVMQGELNRLALLLHGTGEITRVQGEQILAWNLEPVAGSSDQRLIVRFNQPQKETFSLQVQMQTPLGSFPQAAATMQLRPEGATRFAGYFRIINEGAVRLEVVQASGLSQISPEQFPETDATRANLRPTGNQRFAYRFSGAEFALRIQADQILPELGVSELFSYRLGENELAIDSEIELDIREAPVRELLLHVPKGYAIARLTAGNLSDYFVTEPEGQPDADLRLVFGQPISGRQVLQLRLERNKALAETNWVLPRVEVARAKSVRGHIATSANAGFRLTPERTQGLTEITTAFFPRKVIGIQSAFRLSDAAWQVSLRIERLPQTVQADALHLFSIGEGIAYGSSLLNYVVSGAPISTFKVELSDEYFNVEFTGKDIRNWQKIAGGYLVQLHTPVAGAYTLLATYERPFKAQGETLSFSGARPLDAQSEQGHTLIISAFQFQVTPADVSPGLLPLETAEVPAEYRLFFDAPILAAYRYAARPFSLKLALSPLAQGESLSLVVDRAALTTRISNEGQVLTEARYFLKNRGNPHLRLTLPAGTQLWSATVNGATVVPVIDATANLIPLPQSADPNAVLTLDLKLASRSQDPTRVSVGAPLVAAPVMLAEWTLEPDAGQRLIYRAGSLTPIGGVPDVSGFAQLARAFTNQRTGRALLLVPGCLVLIVCGLIVSSWVTAQRTYKFSIRHIAASALTLMALVVASVLFIQAVQLASDFKSYPQRSMAFLAPVQQTGSGLSVQVANVEDKFDALIFLRSIWPALVAALAWSYAWATNNNSGRLAGAVAGWLLLAWSALRAANGAVAFLVIIAVFLLVYVVHPALRRLWSLPRRAQLTRPGPAEGGATSAATAILLGGFLLVTTVGKIYAIERIAPPAVAQSISHDIVTDDKFAVVHSSFRWRADKGDVLPLLFEPAVLKAIRYPTNALKLMQTMVAKEGLAGSSSTNLVYAQQLIARKRGVFDIEVQYEVQVCKRGNESGFTLPVEQGLVNRLKMTVLNLDVDVVSPQAVAIQRELAGSNTMATVVLSSIANPWLGWKPRTRDIKREAPVFYADVSQLYVPGAGVIEGAHLVSIRPAQGEISELFLTVPEGATITDVGLPGPVRGGEGKGEGVTQGYSRAASLVSLWRFDPDKRKLRISLSAPQPRPFTLLIRSQFATGPLPLDKSVGVIAVDNATGQIGLLGIATGNEVQLDSANGDSISAINLEDFPPDLVTSLQTQIPGLSLRRAFRYGDLQAHASLRASPVEPDIRVESQDTISLGEDRTLLAANPSVEITRAGIFRLSFLMPTGFEVESISGAALSHWTELKTDAGRVITLNLNGKTEGIQQFAISLIGPGIKATNGWPVPQLVLREASKQRGTLLLVPEQGLRLQVTGSDGLAQLDPQKSGIKQKGVLAFRVLQTPRSLTLNLEQVTPWIQVTSLQHANVTEAEVKLLANLQYQIENTGLKAFRVLLPTNAEGVHFQGEQIADFLATPGMVTNGLQAWEIKLHRRVIGSYLLQASYQVSLREKAAQTVLRGIQAAEVNLQRGFVTIQSAGRLQLHVDATPAALQAVEWQSIPRALQGGLPSNAANLSYRVVEPGFELPLILERHDAAKLLAARIHSVTFNSVISDDGVMLTQARLEMMPGDKRLLNLTLPKDAHFWFAFVNQSGVWPWREQDRILLPLEQQAREGQAIPVEVFYSCKIGASDRRGLNLELLAPKFDLPLENITWRVSLSDKWQLAKWSGSLQLQHEEVVPQSSVADLQKYLQGETDQQRDRTKQAENLLAAGNSALEQGDPQQARRAFQAAYGLSTHDAAFNEDARVQLHNIKLQQALVGLNVRQAGTAGDTPTIGGKLRELRSRKEINYTQQEAKDILDRNSADENGAFMKLAERLIQQQDAAISSPTALRASVPEQGRVLTFKRAVLVDPWAELQITLKTTAATAASWALRLTILSATSLILLVFFWSSTRRITT